MPRTEIGEIRRQSALLHYDTLIPRLLAWQAEEVSQEEMAEILNAEGTTNVDGKPFNQPTISRILKRARQNRAAMN